MSSTTSTVTNKIFDLIVIGAGSGGMASSRRAAAMYGKKVCLIERYPIHLGGTCVNLGCVPKKIMFQCAHLQDMIDHYLDDYCFKRTGGPISRSISLDWPALVEKREKYLEKLRGIYINNLAKDGVQLVYGTAKLESPNQVSVQLFSEQNGGETVTLQADHILIATGGHALVDEAVPGAKEFGITSDGFFALKERPLKAAVVGAGYIAVELAGVLLSLGTSVSLFTRGPTALRNFEDICRDGLHAAMKASGIDLISNSHLKSLEKDPATGKIKVSFTREGDSNAASLDSYDCVIFAVGRKPNTVGLGLEQVNVKLVNGPGSAIWADEYQNTSVKGIYALGDVCEKVELTPVAIAAGRRLMDRIFGNNPTAKLNYENVPTVVFSHPTIGRVGLTESEARAKYPNRQIRTYKSTFNNLFYAMSPVERKVPTTYKLVCLADDDDRLLGVHLIGLASDEILQGFAVALKMGARKRDLDETVAIHPTAAEELVTMR